jgi:cytochrome c556
MKRSTLLAAAGAAAVAATVAFGATPLVQASEGARVQLASAEQMAAVKERQKLMKAIGANMKQIVDFLKEKKGTAEEAQQAAVKIVALSDRIPEAFKVEASLDEMDAVGKNRGKPEIWLAWDDFTADAKNLNEKAKGLVVAFQSGEAQKVQAAFGDMGKNGCGACHEDFRGPKVE